MTGSAQLHWFTDTCLRVPSQGISHIILGLVIDRQQSGSGHTHSFNSFVDSVEYYSNCKKEITIDPHRSFVSPKGTLISPERK